MKYLYTLRYNINTYSIGVVAMIMIGLAFFILGVMLGILGLSWIPHLAAASYTFVMAAVFFIALGIVTSAIRRLKLIYHDYQANRHKYSH